MTLEKDDYFLLGKHDFYHRRREASDRVDTPELSYEPDSLHSSRDPTAASQSSVQASVICQQL